MPGILILRFVLMGLIVLVMIRTREGDSILSLGLILMSVIVFLNLYPLERPQIFSFLFFGVLLFHLKRMRTGAPSAGHGKHLVVPLLMLLWANTHVGYVLGQATLLLFIVMEGIKFFHPSLRPLSREAYRALCIAGAAGICIAFANPNTYHVWTDMVMQPSFTTAGNIEYQSTLTAFLLFQIHIVVLYWFVLLLAIAGLIMQGKRVDITEVVLLLAAGVVSFITLRYVAVFMIAAVPVVGRIFSETRLLKVSRAVVLAAALAGSILFTWDARANMRNLEAPSWINSAFPLNAADFISANEIRGNMYNYYNWGGYLIWKLAPERKVFIDGRCLDPGIVRKSILIETAHKKNSPGAAAWKSILEAYDVQYILIPFSQPDGTLLPLVPALLAEMDWSPVFLHNNTLIFLKNSAMNEGLLRRYAIPKEHFFQAMIDVCDVFIRMNPGDIFPYLTKGDLYLSRLRLPEARAAYEEVSKIAPFNKTARERLRLLSGLQERLRRESLSR
jgi:hypothetical protein